MYIGKTPTVGNFQVCDAISVVNGQAAYTLQVGGVNVAPESANHMLVSLNGILQKPGSSFTISGSTMTFASNLATGDVIDFVQILGNVLDLGQPSDDTVTAAKLNDNVISGQTALTSSPDDTDELLISDAGTIKRIDVSLVGGKNTPSFHVYESSSQTVTTNTYTKVTLDEELYDTNNNFASSRFTPTTAGKYFIYGNLHLDGSSYPSYTETAIYKNGSVIARNFTAQSSANIYGNKFISTTVDMNGSSDYVELYGKVTQGGTCSFVGGQKEKFFGGYKIIT